ncbi:MAG: 23S rRNA (uracil(1939)-C(5))-methyltransferase RlmD, partial [Thermodesulfobacteriota bacterium]|nr:23S rRNA (uracil(1939)-C(5))-methyltransferase RlmD [Thermodesulfobacteriota bacterium]
RIIYISCNPATQARDIRYLTGRGFSLETLQPVDMFPQTKHIEVVALLTR